MWIQLLSASDASADYFNNYFKRDFDEITADRGAQAPAAILNRQKTYENRGVPYVMPQQKKHRFRRWLNK